jgi:hypothetical protein
MIGGFLWWLPSSKNNSAASIAQKAEERADAEEQLQEHQNRFATTHGAVWIESLLVSPTNSTRFGEPLTADVQQILTPGKPVAFNVWFPDVERDNGNLVLTGRVLLSRKRIDVALVMDDPHWLDLIRTNASVTLKVAAEIESVTPTRVLEVNEGNSGEVVVLRATGHAIGLDISQD